MNTFRTIHIFFLSAMVFTACHSMDNRFATTPRGLINFLQERTFKYVIENGRIYSTGVRAIDFIATNISNFAIWFVHITRSRRYSKPINYALYATIAQQRINQIKNKLLEDEKQIIAGLCTDYNMSKEQQKLITLITDAYKEQEKKYLSQPQNGTTHDIPFGPRAFNHLMETTGINLNSINLIDNLMPNPDSETTSASARGVGMNGEFKDGVFTPKEIQHRPTLNLYPPFWSNDHFIWKQEVRNLQWPNILHEIGHIALHHSATKSLLTNLISELAQTDISTIENNKLCKQLTAKHEEQAEILCKNKNDANEMRFMRHVSYYPDTLFFGHYKRLTEIDELHQFSEKLKNYRPIPIQKIDSLKTINWSLPLVAALSHELSS